MADLLEACKREVANSNQWKLFSQQLFVHIQRHLSAGNVMSFTDLTEQQRLHLTTQASEEIKQSNNSVYQDMVATVSSTMDRSINQYASLHKGNRSRNDFTMELLAGLSSQLLAKWPNHKHLLVQCFNRRLPVVLRITAWKVMLQNKQIYQSYVTKATSASSRDPASTGYHVYQQCQHLIGSNKMFSLLAENGLCLQVMKDVVVFWKLQCGKQQLSRVDILLAVPFVFLRLRELNMIKQGAKINIDQLAGMIAEQYVSFMTQRPPTMMDGEISVSYNTKPSLACQTVWGWPKARLHQTELTFLSGLLASIEVLECSIKVFCVLSLVYILELFLLSVVTSMQHLLFHQSIGNSKDHDFHAEASVGTDCWSWWHSLPVTKSCSGSWRITFNWGGSHFSIFSTCIASICTKAVRWYVLCPFIACVPVCSCSSSVLCVYSLWFTVSDDQEFVSTRTGDVSMDVVCFIWDQCFIGLGIGGYQYIPYLITVLLLIMKEPMLQCKEVSSLPNHWEAIPEV